MAADVVVEQAGIGGGSGHDGGSFRLLQVLSGIQAGPATGPPPLHCVSIMDESGHSVLTVQSLMQLDALRDVPVTVAAGAPGWATRSNGCTCSRRPRWRECCAAGSSCSPPASAWPGCAAGELDSLIAAGRPRRRRRDRVRAEPRPGRAPGRPLRAARPAAARVRAAGAVRRRHPRGARAAGVARAGNAAARRRAAVAAARGGAPGSRPRRPGGGAGRRAGSAGAAGAPRPNADRELARRRPGRRVPGFARPQPRSACRRALETRPVVPGARLHVLPRRGDELDRLAVDEAAFLLSVALAAQPARRGGRGRPRPAPRSGWPRGGRECLRRRPPGAVGRRRPVAGRRCGRCTGAGRWCGWSARVTTCWSMGSAALIAVRGSTGSRRAWRVSWCGWER